MSFRSSDLAVQGRTKARLRMVLKLYHDSCMAKVNIYRETGYPPYRETERIMTADELGDRILNEVIKEKYPLVIECEKEIAKVEQDMIAKAKA